MAYTTTELITNAYYASGIVSREFETVSGAQITEGLQWLNDILAEKVVDEDMIPYIDTYTFNFVTGQETYYIPDLVDVDTLVFYLNNVRFSMQYTQRNQYFGAPRVENIQTLPFQWYVEKQFGGANLYVYFEPDTAYPAMLKGNFRLSAVTLGQDLSLTLDQFYITYLRYALAARICAEFNFDVPPGVMAQLNKYEAWIAKQSNVLDLTLQKRSTLTKRQGYNWAFVNLARGWVPY